MSYEFKVGDKGKTIAGFDYEILAIDGRLDPYPIIAIIKCADGNFASSTHTLTGKFFGLKDIKGTNFNLIPPPRKLTFYINVYEDDIYGYLSEEYATSSASGNALLIARKVEFEIEGGAP